MSTSINQLDMIINSIQMYVFLILGGIMV